MSFYEKNKFDLAWLSIEKRGNKLLFHVAEHFTVKHRF